MADLLSGINWAGMGDEVAALMREHYGDLMALAYDTAGGELPVSVSFDLENEDVQRVIGQLADKIKNVSDTTRDKVRALVAQQAQEGWSMSELAKRIREQGVTDSKYRSEMIARTESREGYNRGSLLAYNDAGVGKVEALDSDNDPECAARNGKTFTLEEAAAIEAHPNCVLSWAPIVE